MANSTPIAYCFAIPPIRAILMAHLPAMDIVTLSISLGIGLIESEEATYLSPAKDILHSSCLTRCSLYHQALCTFLGKDLPKPITTLRSNATNLKRAPVEIRLILLVGCLTSDNAELLLQCRKSIIDAFRNKSNPIINHLNTQTDERNSYSVLIPSIGTTIYLLNPRKSSSDRSIGIEYLRTGILDAIFKPPRPLHRPTYTFEHTVRSMNSSMFQDSSTIRYFRWCTEHPYFLLQIEDMIDTAVKVLISF